MSRDPAVAARIAEARRLRVQGFTLQRIGDLLGITRERVRQYLTYQREAGECS